MGEWVAVVVHRASFAERSVLAQRCRRQEASMGTDVPTQREQADLPAGDLLARRNALPAPLQALHRRVLLTLARTGQPPTDTELGAWASELHLELDTALGAFAAAELVFLDSTGGRISGGVPFAATPTAHQVRIAGGPVVSANCAVDALGIGAMLERDTDVRSTDPHTGEAITAISRAGQWSWQPTGAVVFVGSTTDGPAQGGRLTDSCCPVINFFTTIDNAHTYQQEHNLTGVVLALPDAAAAGALVFGDLLHEPHPAERTP